MVNSFLTAEGAEDAEGRKVEVRRKKEDVGR
jgi:hypothetical protein